MASTRTHRGRTIALVAAVGVVAVAAVAAVRWEALATRYHVYRLQSDESYLEQLIDLPEVKTAQGTALREYCQTEDGAAALVHVLVSKVPPDLRIIDIHLKGGDCWFQRPPRQQGQISLRDPFRVHRLLSLVDGRAINLETHPSLTFRVKRLGRGVLIQSFTVSDTLKSDHRGDNDPPP